MNYHVYVRADGTTEIWVPPKSQVGAQIVTRYVHKGNKRLLLLGQDDKLEDHIDKREFRYIGALSFPDERFAFYAEEDLKIEDGILLLILHRISGWIAKRCSEHGFA